MPSAVSIAALFTEHRGSLVSYLVRKGIPHPDVDDLLQEILVAACRSIDSYDARRAPLRTWLLGIATLKIKDYRRSVRRRHEDLLPEEGFEPICDGAPNSEVRLILQGRKRVLDELLSEIPEEPRRIFVMYELEGHEMTEIAQRLSITLSTAWARHRQAWRDLEAAVRRWQARQRWKGYDDVPVVLVPLLEEVRVDTALAGLRVPSRPDSSPPDRGATACRPRTGIRQQLGGPALVLALGVLGPVDASCVPVKATAMASTLPSLAHLTAAPPVENSSPVVMPAPDPSPSPVARPARRPAEPDQRPQVEVEAKYVFRAEIALLAGQIEFARSLLEQHERQFRDGELAPKRDALLRQISGAKKGEH